MEPDNPKVSSNRETEKQQFKKMMVDLRERSTIDSDLGRLGKEIGKPKKNYRSIENIGNELAQLAHKTSYERQGKATHVLFGSSGAFVQYIAKPQFYLLWYCIILFLQSMLVNGFINSSLATIEKRYKLSSLESSFVASSYDIGCILVVLLVSYYGNSHHKVKWIGIGGIIMGIGSFIVFFPQLFSGKYEYGASSSMDIPICKNTTNVEKCDLGDRLNRLRNFKFFFYLGTFVVGIGASPLFTLGIAYIEEIVDKPTSALYVGISTSVTAIGPAVGYVVFGLFLKIYVDIKIPSSEMTADNTDIWVGAWWLGFLIAGIAFILFAMPLVFFPRPKSLETSLSGGYSMKMADVKDILKLSKSILTNITYNCLTVSTALTMLSLSGLSTYGPKYLETMFGLTASSSTITAGIVTVPTLVTGALVGGIIMSHYNFQLKGALLFMCVTTLISIPMVLAFFFKCSAAKMAGVNINYTNGSSTDKGLTSSCNQNCNCLSSRTYFRPTCGVDNLAYYSPCYAGCTDIFQINNSYFYKSCQCISVNKTTEDGNQLFDKICPAVICVYFYAFLVVLGLYLFFTYLKGAPMITATMRSVNPQEISLSLGIQSIISRVFGSVPGPMIFGYVIDTACIYWFEKCNNRGNCMKYNDVLYSTSFFILMIVITAGKAACFIVASCSIWKK